LFLVCCCCCYTLKMSSPDFNKMAKAIKDEVEKNKNVIWSSWGKDIVSFVGNTGAGKSTVVNILAGIAMVGDDYREFVLKDKTDKRAMTVGKGGESVTSYPKGISVGRRVFFDFPGFADTRGGEKDIVNAALMHNVFSNAVTNLIVFVISWDQVTAARGTIFKQVLDETNKWISCSSASITEGKCFVFTKIDEGITTDQLKRALSTKYPQCYEILNPFFDEGRVFQVPRPRPNMSANKSDIQAILSKLNSFSGVPVTKMKIGITLPVKFSSCLTNMFYSELSRIMESVFDDVRNVTCQGSLKELAYSLYSIKKKLREVQEADFLSGLCLKTESQPEISLLLPLCGEQWNVSKTTFMKEKEDYKQKWINWLKDNEAIINLNLQKIWDSLVNNKTTQFIEEQKQNLQLSPGSYNLQDKSPDDARSQSEKLTKYLESKSYRISQCLQLIRKEADAFQEQTGTCFFNGESLPDNIEKLLKDFFTSVDEKRKSIDEFITKETQRIEKEKAEKEKKEKEEKLERERKEREDAARTLKRLYPGQYCDRGHRLYHILGWELIKIEPSYRSGIICNSCQRKIAASEGIRHCDECNYDLCHYCYDGVPVPEPLLNPSFRPYDPFNRPTNVPGPNVPVRTRHMFTLPQFPYVNY